MRLYDKIMASPGSTVDKVYFGSFTNIAKRMAGAQCFLIEQELANACEEVCLSKPSSIVSALNRTRMPYPKVWMEWHPNQRSMLTVQNDKPKPTRMGCLVLSNKTGDKGTAIYIWEHSRKDSQVPVELREKGDFTEITLDPFGIIFDWSGSEEPVISQYAKTVGIEVKDEIWKQRYGAASREAYRESLRTTKRWKGLSHFEDEVDSYMLLEKSAAVVPIDECRDLFTHPIASKHLLPGGKMYDGFMEDLEGEFAYTQALVLMLNTRNSVIQHTKEDLSRLNKARAKNRRSPLQEFTITNLKLNKVHARTADATGLSREAARRHMVRGHFKLRSSGVYWWSAHVRGLGSELIKRDEYKVNL